MGHSTKGEKGILKLVHPGRHVEIHTRPITAAEVMSRNPRHCVTRPDVFKFPYIVVRPESILYPGQVLYIVPNCTIHKLLKSKSKVQINNSSSKMLSPSVDLADSGRRDCCSSYLEAWPMIRMNRNSYLEFKDSYDESSTAEDRSVCRNENSCNSSSNVAGMDNYDDCKSSVEFHKQVDRLKPCLKNNDRSRDQKVTFASPIVTGSY